MNETNKNTRGRNVKRPVLLHTSDPDVMSQIVNKYQKIEYNNTSI